MWMCLEKYANVIHSLHENCLFLILILLKFVPNDVFNKNTPLVNITTWRWAGADAIINPRFILF